MLSTTKSGLWQPCTCDTNTTLTTATTTNRRISRANVIAIPAPTDGIELAYQLILPRLISEDRTGAVVPTAQQAVEYLKNASELQIQKMQKTPLSLLQDFVAKKLSQMTAKNVGT